MSLDGMFLGVNRIAYDRRVLFAELAAVSAQVGATRSRSAKIRALAECLRTLADHAEPDTLGGRRVLPGRAGTAGPSGRRSRGGAPAGAGSPGGASVSHCRRRGPRPSRLPAAAAAPRRRAAAAVRPGFRGRARLPAAGADRRGAAGRAGRLAGGRHRRCRRCAARPGAPGADGVGRPAGSGAGGAARRR